MKQGILAAGLLAAAGCATLPAVSLDPADPLGPALVRADRALRALAADLSTGAVEPRFEPALDAVARARVALAVRQVTLGVRLGDVALGATMIACRDGVLRLTAAPRDSAAREATRAFALACLAPLSAVTAGIPAMAEPADQRL